MSRRKTCEIAISRECQRPCGQPARWWSDDVRKGCTVWMCEQCCSDLMMNADSIPAFAECNSCGEDHSYEDIQTEDGPRCPNPHTFLRSVAP